MSNFTKSFNINTEFEGDEIALVVTRMKRKDALKLVPHMGEPDAEGKIKISFSGQIELLDIAADLLPKYINSMAGLKDADGVAISVDDMLDGAYFLDLVGNIVNELMTKSFMSKSDVKKSNAPHVNTSEDSTTIKSLP